MPEIKLFNDSVGVIMRENDPWFIARDVAACLGYAKLSSSIHEHCRKIELLKYAEVSTLTDHRRGLLAIPESDVYRVIMKSILPTAEAARDWIFEEVLPLKRSTIMRKIKFLGNPPFGSLRVIMRENGLWFVGHDVDACLEYALPGKSFRKHCKKVEFVKTADFPSLTRSPNGVSIIPESDFYRLIMTSHLPIAESIQDWIVEEVLPSMRKPGAYILDFPDFGVKEKCVA